MNPVMTLLIAPLMASALLLSTPAMADHARGNERPFQRNAVTTVFIGGAGDRHLAEALRDRVYPNLRGNMRPSPQVGNADIRVRVDEMQYQPTFRPLKRKIKHGHVQVREQLHLQYAYRVTVFKNGREIDSTILSDVVRSGLNYNEVVPYGARAHYVNNQRGQGREEHMSRNRALEQARHEMLDRISVAITHRLQAFANGPRYERRQSPQPSHREGRRFSH